MGFLEISKWCNPKSLMVINAKGKLKRLSCPFIVICIDPVGELTEFKPYSVSMVKSTDDGRIVYEISGILFFHTCFKIIDQ